MAVDASIRQALCDDMLDYHRKRHPELELHKKNFYPKVPFVFRNVKCISMYEKEIVGTYYTELCTTDYAGPDNPQRNLLKWTGNEHSLGELQKAQDGERYFVPIDELQIVPILSSVKIEKGVSESTLSVLDEGDDCHVKEMTLRDRCAIEWKKPVSNKEWLNKLIKENFK